MNNHETTNLHTSFRIFRKKSRGIWEEYSYLNECVKNADKKPYKIAELNRQVILNKTKVDAEGMSNKFVTVENAKMHFINMISLFEDYISKLTIVVYISYPKKLEDANNDKLLDVILKYENKEDMIKHIAEEKVRRIFYGNPTDIFLKDKCQFNLKDVFSIQYKEAIDLYREIIGRRNIIIHNLGKVDNKYLKENPDSKLKNGQKVIISEEYLRGTIALLTGIAAKTTEAVINNIFKGHVGGKLKKAINTFENCYQNDWYKTLLK